MKVIYHINRIKDKTHHMIISLDAEKAFDKTQQHFIMVTFTKQRIEGNFFNLIKSILEAKH